jgi:ketosteroid isomerase-like protein
MTSDSDRAWILERALRAGVDRDRQAIVDSYTEDVRAWTPAMSTSSRTELMEELERRDDAFSDIELEVAPLAVGGGYACAEWSASMTHAGRLEVAGGMAIEPTGVRVTVHGATVAEFRGDQICSLRQYWDELSVVEQLGVPSHGLAG